jgi:hypothetical protein
MVSMTGDTFDSLSRGGNSGGGGAFISEPITPDKGGFDPSALTSGLAGLPAGFTWRGRRYVIEECLEHRKVTAPEGHREGNERYLRRQEFVVRLDTGQTAVLYIERQASRGASAKAARQRWFLYTITPPDDAEEGGKTADHCRSVMEGVP